MKADDILALPFDQYQRYKIVQETVEQLRDKKPIRILDIGGAPGLLRQFLPEDEVVVADMQECDIPNYVKADALSLPFADQTFDIVTALDVLEHITPNDRGVFLAEVSRVADRTLIMAAPFNTPDVPLYETLMNSLHKGFSGQDHYWMKEHIENGLPNLQETVEALKEIYSYVSIASNGYLPRWLKMISVNLCFMEHGVSNTYIESVNRYYNERFYPYDNKPDSYRKMIVASMRKAEVNVSAGPEDDMSAQAEKVLDLLVGNVQKMYMRKIYTEQDKQITLMGQQISEKDWRIEEMLNSNSWKITAPLRRLSMWIRRACGNDDGVYRAK